MGFGRNDELNFIITSQQTLQQTLHISTALNSYLCQQPQNNILNFELLFLSSKSH